MSISIVHYNPIEYYPPVHNLIKYLDLRLKIVVHSTYPNNVTIPNKYSGVKILRFSKFRSKTLFMRYFNFFLFTLKSFAYLLRDSPKVILYFETWSCLPVFLYKIIRPRTSILVHHHEYTSSVDIKNSPSSQLKFLYKIEKKLLRRISWISHTNQERLEMYLEENEISENAVKTVIPNYPPLSWCHSPHEEKKDIIRLVYVGSLSLENMYIKEVIEWVIKQNGIFSLDVYSLNIHKPAKDFINGLKSNLVTFKNGVDYDNLPEVIKNYDVGLVIYKGVSLNYVYNAPNKLFEYWACGLDVWFSSDLITSKEFVTEGVYPKILEVNFRELDKFDWQSTIDRKNLDYQPSPYYCEAVLSELYNQMVKILE